MISQHYTEKTHYFRDEEDNRTVVVTTMLDDGSYEATTVVEQGEVCGYGDTRMAAIANLQSVLDMIGDGT
jgi:hypothetical protein